MARARSAESHEATQDPRVGYQVVARRYRPQTFAEVVGQDHVVQALRNAIDLKRVTHAYVFSGTRGVGKTSIARIFAKCLNCSTGPTDTPCNTCDICQAISLGQDVDVIEIDGASNNGVEQVRELRQNASLRPSRARYKIYYIDEVHMLSTGAFNALLKTLEEPPEHVKFFFATTEPGKIPVTVLSRCQRFDFAGIRPEAIAQTLQAICDKEGIEADSDALMTVARRAAGSMRDAQSLLEQLLSSGQSHLTEEVIHAALGLAPDERVLDLIDAIANHDPGTALRLVDSALSSGVQSVDLLAGLLEFLRDVLVLAAGAGNEIVNAAPSVRPRLAALARQTPVDTLLVQLQILSEARQRMRGATMPRLILEIAVCRAARLEDFAELSELIDRLSGAPLPPGGSTPGIKKKTVAPEPDAGNRTNRPARPAPVPAGGDRPDAEPPDEPPASQGGGDSHLHTAWKKVAVDVGPTLGKHLLRFTQIRLAAPDRVEIIVPQSYHFSADICEQADNRTKIEASLRAELGQTVALQFTRQAGEPRHAPKESPQANRALRHEDLESDDLVQDLVKLFEARPIHVEIDDEGDLG